MKEGKKYIFVVDSGWVFMGLFGGYNARGDIIVKEALNLRVWGTTAGLGEIALHGPTKSTEADGYGEVFVPPAKLLFSIPCVYED